MRGYVGPRHVVSWGKEDLLSVLGNQQKVTELIAQRALMRKVKS